MTLNQPGPRGASIGFAERLLEVIGSGRRTATWAKRREKIKPPLDRYTLRLLTSQHGLCPLCGDYLLSAGQPPQSPRQWETWWLSITRKAVAASYLTHHGQPGMPHDDQTRLVHASCQRALQARQRRNPEFQPATPSRLA